MAATSREPFRTWRQFMIDTYGAPMHRVALDLGFGCPHRRADGTGGCAFCPPDGSRARQTAGAATLAEQIRGGVEFARRRYGATRFMAYVQAYTGTLAPVERQRALVGEILSAFPFDALSIASRPDCLPPDTLDWLADLRDRIELWIELGIQSVHDDTLRRINRGHGWAAGRDAVLALAGRRIRAAAHVILGLPGETPEHARVTAGTLAALPFDGIKIHNLHVVRGTDLAEQFRRAPFPVYGEREYAELAIDFIRRLPPRVAIIRLNTDTPDADLIAPRWTMKKGQFRDYLTQRMIATSARQGDRRAGAA